MGTYRPDSDRAQEVRLFEGTKNPSPIIELLEQVRFRMSPAGAL